MKFLITAFSASMLAASLAPAQQRQEMRDAATHDQLSSQLRRVDSTDPMKKLAPAQGKDPSVENRPQDLLSRSDILCYRGLATLVPKGSILVTPPLVADRVGMKAGAKIVPWLDFFTANRGWIVTQEITLAQAEGKVPMSDAVTEKLLKSSNLVVATLQGGPISKLAPKPEAAPAQPATPAAR